MNYKLISIYEEDHKQLMLIKVIEEEKLITAEFGEKLRQMAKFRNRLVHLYGEVENSYVYQFIQEDLSDIEKLRILLLKRYIPK